MLVDSLESPELSRFLRELLARSSLMVSAFEPASLSLCGVDEHAAIAAALRAGDAERAIALSGEHFRHIEERLAQGLAERANVSIEQALAPADQIASAKESVKGESGQTRTALTLAEPNQPFRRGTPNAPWHRCSDLSFAALGSPTAFRLIVFQAYKSYASEQFVDMPMSIRLRGSIGRGRVLRHV